MPPIRFGMWPWALATPIEVVLLDNVEIATTYSATGATGLLAGEIPLPAPRNHHYPAILYAVSMETKQGPLTAKNTAMDIRSWDGTTERTLDSYFVSDDVADRYRFYPFSYLEAYLLPPNSVTSYKGNPNLKVRLYLVGDPASVDEILTCRNLVVTIVPLYK